MTGPSSIEHRLAERPAAACAHSYKYDVCIIGAGRIGLPWGAKLAAHGYTVMYIDVDTEVVDAITDGQAPFSEPGLDDCLTAGVDAGRIHATTDPCVVSQAKFVACTLNAPWMELDRFVDALREYTPQLTTDQVVILRTTLSIEATTETIHYIADDLNCSARDVPVVVFPERLAEGNALTEIESLPKILGAQTEPAEYAVRALLAPFDCPIYTTTPANAMFVKLIDNTYRDAQFAIANQFALIADVLDQPVDAHEAISLANCEYPRNDIPHPGPVGGKCLTKDPNFLMTPNIMDRLRATNLFRYTRTVNDEFIQRITDRVTALDPTRVALLGTTFKPDVDDELHSPALDIKTDLEAHDIHVDCFDPHVPDRDSLTAFLQTDTHYDACVLAVNHSEFVAHEDAICNACSGPLIDVWGVFDSTHPHVVRIGDSHTNAPIRSQESMANTHDFHRGELS